MVDTEGDLGVPCLGISLNDLLGGDEPVGDAKVEVDEAVLRAALETGMFSARGAGRFGFAHKTYGEFLTARYLSTMKLGAAQLESLLLGPRDHVRFFRNALINQLRQAGTREACVALRVVRDACPKYPWLSEVLLQAEAAERQSSWSPPPATVLRRLFADRRLRVITTTTQLLDVLTESLGRFAQSLHGELPARTTLWNQLLAGTYRPKDEEHLSDAIARHFRADLIERGTIVNREVQIRRREVANASGGEAGQRTDIRVDVIRPADRGEPSLLTAIVEVKGCWHSEVESAMASQLAGRYLRDNDCQTGLYLVGWYFCDGWDNSDGRKRQVPWTTIQTAESQLNQQAAALTTRNKTPEIRAYVLDCALR